MASPSNCSSALLPRRILNPLQHKASTKDPSAMRFKDSTDMRLKDSQEETSCLPTVSPVRASTAVLNLKETNSTLVSKCALVKCFMTQFLTGSPLPHTT